MNLPKPEDLLTDMSNHMVASDSRVEHEANRIALEFEHHTVLDMGKLANRLSELEAAGKPLPTCFFALLTEAEAATIRDAAEIVGALFYVRTIALDMDRKDGVPIDPERERDILLQYATMQTLCGYHNHARRHLDGSDHGALRSDAV